jgi:hypothetical protein
MGCLPGARLCRRDVVARFNAVHSAAERRLVLTDDGDGSVTAQYVAMRILRKDNYLVAMMNQDVVNMTVAVPWLGRKRVPFTKCFEWNLRVRGSTAARHDRRGGTPPSARSLRMCGLTHRRWPCWTG